MTPTGLARSAIAAMNLAPLLGPVAPTAPMFWTGSADRLF